MARGDPPGPAHVRWIGGNNQGPSAVNLMTLTTINSANGLIQLEALFQNEMQACIPALSNVNSITFSAVTDASVSSGSVSFCLSDMKLLPPAVAPSSECLPHSPRVITAIADSTLAGHVCPPSEFWKNRPVCEECVMCGSVCFW